MSEKLRDSIYAAAVAVAALLVALGVIDAATENTVLGVVTAILAAAGAIAPVIAHLHLGSKGVEAIEGETVPDAAPEPAVQADATDVQGHTV